MPSLFEPAPFALWQLLALACLVVCAAGASVYLLRKHLADDDGLPDAVFWDGFAGLAIVAPAVILPALVAPWSGLLLGVIAAAAAASSYLWTPRIFSWQAERRSTRDTAASNQAAAARHRSALARWQRYEMDPAHAIDYPAMSDPRQPETAALIRAMKAAEQLRTGTDAGYARAVERLEEALAEAERAAGVGRDAPTRDAGFPAADPALG
ncbi:hypothetical protein [Arthrobacter sp. PsM3]|uniref:hypothetical protein n=1 Tax=Arthrobacter sp. PsM3 TaxID=3030531 RepID=UPI00263B38A5|nr:hypothetical protein [Arthrobacter sp. PsM3]MDN4645050.1 hypothetical protein [Arthrobacter sp. PsM3]